MNDDSASEAKAGGNDAGARFRVASQEHFARWWKNHPIQMRANEDDMLSGMLGLIHDVAQGAWNASGGMIAPSHRDERIERLEDHAQYLRLKIFNERPLPNARANALLSALEWAIPIVVRATGAPTAPASRPSDAPSK